MMGGIREFWAFTKLSYKLLIFLVMPAVHFGTYWLYNSLLELPVFALGLVSITVIVAAETMIDQMLLGSFYKKNNSALEYLQSSNYFGDFIKHIVIVDMLRKLVMYVGGYLLWGLFLIPERTEYLQGLMAPVFTVLVVNISCFIERHFNNWSHAYVSGFVTGFIGCVLLMILSIFQMEAKGNMLVTEILLLIMALLVAGGIWGTVRYSLRKVRESYYD